jgi:hypothetical protein
MPLYYLCYGSGAERLENDESLELPDLDAAVRLAIRGARDIMAEDMRSGRLDLDQHIVIRDGAARCLARVDFVHALEISLPRFRPSGR